MEEIKRNEREIKNQAIVNALYKSLAAGDMKSAGSLLATDLEWWFHGPQNCHHMMRMLTGEALHTEFKFEPRTVTTIDDHIDDHYVIVEGYEGANVYWVHVWVLKDGLITCFREFFNTWLTVTKPKKKLVEWPLGGVWKDNRSIVWRSHPGDLFRRSLPGLMLVI